MALKLRKKQIDKVASLDKKNLGNLAKEYAEISSQIKLLDSRKKEIAKLLKEGAVKYGTKDDKGSSYFESCGYTIGNVSKVSMSLDHAKGAVYLEKKGLGDLVDVETIKTVNESKLEKALSEGRITLSEIDGFTNRKQNYQVSVKAVEDMPEVEQSNFSVAARRK